jgi:hypothetical protein
MEDAAAIIAPVALVAAAIMIVFGELRWSPPRWSGTGEGPLLEPP